MTARILIIEDEEPLTLLLRYNLEAEGYSVESAVRGDEADLKVKENPPALAVIDFPEGGLNSNIAGYNHCVGAPSSNCYANDFKTPFTGWHTATIEWSPGKLSYILDGKTGTTTTSIPSSPMHWVLQTETAGGGKPAADVAGHLQIDWVSVYSYAP